MGRVPEAEDKKIIKLFEEKQLDVNSVLDEYNTSVLQEACFRGRFEVAKYLVEHGANVNNLAKPSGSVALTALQNAVQSGDEDLILLLLEKGADVNTKNGHDEPLIFMVIDKLNNANLSEDKKEGFKNIIKAILSKDVNLNVFNRNDNSPLYEASRFEDLEVIQWFLDKGADPNAYGPFGKPPLYAAVNQPNVDIVNLLIKKGASVKPEPKSHDVNKWQPPLNIAVGAFHSSVKEWKPNQEIIKLLVNSGADINQAGVFGKTPLHIAAQRGDSETAKLLIELGANPAAVDATGKTPVL